MLCRLNVEQSHFRLSCRPAARPRTRPPLPPSLPCPLVLPPCVIRRPYLKQADSFAIYPLLLLDVAPLFSSWPNYSLSPFPSFQRVRPSYGRCTLERTGTREGRRRGYNNPGCVSAPTFFSSFFACACPPPPPSAYPPHSPLPPLFPPLRRGAGKRL